MESKYIVLYLGLKGMSAAEIHDNLVATHTREAVCNGSVARSLRSRSSTSVTDPKPNVPPDPVFTESDEAILAALEESPFSSIRQFARATHLTPSRVSLHLTQKLGYTVRHLRCVPHTLSAADKLVRARLLMQSMGLLGAQRRKSWQDMRTLDDSWFYFTTDSECIWLPQHAPPPETQRLTISDKKMMVTIGGNPACFWGIAARPKGSKFHINSFIPEISTRIAA
jgi:hypothetical protein